MADRPLAIATLLIAFAMLLAVGLAGMRRPAELNVHAACEPVTFRIDANHADAEMLCLLPSIGPGIAQRIIDDREAGGPFRDARDMQRVRMVGEKTAAAITPWARFESVDE